LLLLVGLGNPGPRYAGHRHTVGFMAADEIVRRRVFSPWRTRFGGEVAEGHLGGERTIVLKPQTFMNESSKAVGEAVRYLKVPLERMVVFHDELDLAPGRVRMKKGGGAGGHNGLRDIDAHVGKDYRRVRIGIGHPGHKDLVADYVLHKASGEEQGLIDPAFDRSLDVMPWIAKGKMTDAMTWLHTKVVIPAQAGIQPKTEEKK
jgi:PTH1 family peptidyl-tRNA hydrolase